MRLDANIPFSKKIPTKGILSVALLFFLLTACSPTKKLKQGQFLLDKVEVTNTKETYVPKEEFEAFFRQKPNRKLLHWGPLPGIHFFVWWYNLFDEENIKKKKIARNLKYDKKNADKILRFEKKNKRRVRKGKKPKTPKLKDKESAILLENIRDIGEPAVVLDSSLTEQTRYQLSRFLVSKGYFNNEVKDSIGLVRDSKKAHVKYILIPKQPYVISQVSYKLDDKNLGALILSDSSNCLLKRGDIYDDDKRKAERQRITDFALNNGYYYFETAYLDFKGDSGFNNHTVAISIHLKKYARHYDSSSDSLVLTNHPQLTINDIYVITEPVVGNVREYTFTDTVITRRNGFKFLSNGPLKFRRKLISQNIEIFKGRLFKRDTAEKTYKQLLGLGIFRNVTVQFFANRDNPNTLDCFILCNPLIKQSITTEPQLTNTSGNLGVDLGVLYQNRNTFRAGELTELKFQGSIAAQAQFNTDNENKNNINPFARTFNTIQFGPELTFSVPRAFFPFSLLPFTKDMSPRTYIKSSFNYQTRPQFNRIIYSVDYGFNFKTFNNSLRHDIVPLEVYFVKANLSSAFKNELTALNDAFLVNSFQDHVTTVSKYVLTYVSKENSNTSNKPANYVRWSIQSSGNILRKLFDVIGHEKDTLGRYLVFGIPFAHFIRSDIDYRRYIPVRKKSRVVFRIAGGIGRPLVNLNVLPYEQSFFSGGPNSVRAWRARTLGPGGYDPSNSLTRFDKIGDILLESNIEYRFHMIKSFYGALFIDAGNIWRLYPDATKPRSEFLPDFFLDQVAIGTGVGIRWDLNFFVLRLDLAAPIKDPKFPPGSRWTFDKKFLEYTVANFGIGYPF